MKRRIVLKSCSNCGQPFIDNQKYCKNCNYRFKTDSPLSQINPTNDFERELMTKTNYKFIFLISTITWLFLYFLFILPFLLTGKTITFSDFNVTIEHISILSFIGYIVSTVLTIFKCSKNKKKKIKEQTELAGTKYAEIVEKEFEYEINRIQIYLSRFFFFFPIVYLILFALILILGFIDFENNLIIVYIMIILMFAFLANLFISAIIGSRNIDRIIKNWKKPIE